ncbi:MAG: hypothetical protein RBR35_01090 [Salinivirgaceae bacterium]|jgi:hypothetical protein|nr:hypothetical protein [Salinivirgaceae bacterium]
MEALYRIKANEIDLGFIEAVKKMFAEKEIIIRITEEFDETEYLSRYKANESHILKNSVAEPAKRFKDGEFEEYTSKKL